jgi:hypothetical protein
VGEQGFGLRKKGAAIHCQADTLLATLEQVQAEEFFQLGNLPAQRRLRYMQPFRRAPDVFFLGDGDEIAQLT